MKRNTRVWHRRTIISLIEGTIFFLIGLGFYFGIVALLHRPIVILYLFEICAALFVLSIISPIITFLLYKANGGTKSIREILRYLDE